MEDPYKKVWEQFEFHIPQYIKDQVIVSIRNNRINEILQDEKGEI